MDSKSNFGADPERIDRLLLLGLENSHLVEETDLKTSSDFFTEKPGSWVGKYKLLSVLGEGGMGIVYLAEQQEPIRRKVALKVIKPGMDSKRVIARFEAERQALALLDHPNIAHVYDAGTTEAGRPYFVMEFVKGLSITEHCDCHKLTIKERLRLFQQVCQAVQHAHQKGIIHRDIKPSNILVSMPDGKAVPKIIDFGVAKAISQPLTERTLATEDTQLLGTPEYMSPEQADKASEDIDTRSDIYSLGVLLYVLLTGVLPFDSDTFSTGGLENIRRTIREADPKTPSTRLSKLGEEARKIAENRNTEIHTLAKHLKKELEWIPLKAMRKERTDRYRSASELADDIENYLNGEPLIAGPPGTGYKLKKFIRRNHVLVGGIAAVIVVLVAGIVVSTIFAVGQSHARVQAGLALSEAQLITDFLENDVLGSVNQEANPDETTLIYTMDTASKSLAAGKFKNKPLIEARIYLTLGKTYTRLGEYEKGEQYIRRATDIYQQHLGPKHPDTLNAMGHIGWVCLKQGRQSEMEKIYTRVLQLGQGVLSVERQVGVKNMLGVAYYGLGKNKEAELLYEEILQVVQNKLEGKHSLLPYIKGNLAVVYLHQGRYDEAEQIYKELIRADEESENYDGINHGLYKSLGMTYKAQGRYDEAEKFLTEALKAIRLQMGSEHPQVIHYMLYLAQLHIDQKRYDDAEKLLLEAVAVSYVKLGDTHPHTLKLINNLITLYEAWNKPEKAKEWRTKLPKTEAVEE